MTPARHFAGLCPSPPHQVYQGLGRVHHILRSLPILNNLLGYFLGLVAWFAVHLESSMQSLA